jgi:hypothetical protein
LKEKDVEKKGMISERQEEVEMWGICASKDTEHTRGKDFETASRNFGRNQMFVTKRRPEDDAARAELSWNSQERDPLRELRLTWPGPGALTGPSQAGRVRGSWG